MPPPPSPPLVQGDPFHSFAALIPAAGASRRLGHPKQLVQVDGRTLLGRTVEVCLEAGAWPVIVVLGAQAEAIRPALARLPVLMADNPAWAEGLGSSIRAGAALLAQQPRAIGAVVILPCDLVALTAGALRRLVEARRTSGLDMAAARYRGSLGTPALFGRSCFAALGRLSGDRGARSVLQDDPALVAAVDLPELEADMDTPEETGRT